MKKAAAQIFCPDLSVTINAVSSAIVMSLTHSWLGSGKWNVILRSLSSSAKTIAVLPDALPLREYGRASRMMASKDTVTLASDLRKDAG